MKPSFINSTLYGPQAVIGDSVGPCSSSRGLCDHRKLCGAPQAANVCSVDPSGSYRSLGGSHWQIQDAVRIPGSNRKQSERCEA